ncbi:MAG: cyclic nucleotide-binding domain-containing protein [Burkholderiales bacterium]|nr:cyclic nucleotide-binding domain-containing protein [Burkholderiales bacterium]
MKADDVHGAEAGARTSSGTAFAAGTPQAGAAKALLAATPVFQKFDAADLVALIERSSGLQFIRHADGADIVREGEPASRLLVIREGSARVLKRSEGGGEHEVNRLGTGDCIGELALIDPAPRSATVRADGPVEVLAIPIADLLALAAERPRFALGLLGMARLVAERLRNSTATVVQQLERALEEERTRSAMGKFTFMLIVTYSLYTWVLGTATQVKQALGRSELVTLPAVVVTVTMLFWFMRSSGYPAAFFGLTLKRVGRHVLEALALTLPLMAVAVALKWWLVHNVPSMAGQPLIQLGSPPAPGLAASTFNPWLAVAYVIFVPLQELIYRGGLQGALEHFLTGPWRRALAIIGSNIIFSAAHLYISPGLSVSAFVAGLFWGWLYARQRGLVGVSLSHALLGFWAFEIVDLGVLE